MCWRRRRARSPVGSMTYILVKLLKLSEDGLASYVSSATCKYQRLFMYVAACDAILSPYVLAKLGKLPGLHTERPPSHTPSENHSSPVSPCGLARLEGFHAVVRAVTRPDVKRSEMPAKRFATSLRYACAVRLRSTSHMWRSLGWESPKAPG